MFRPREESDTHHYTRSDKQLCSLWRHKDFPFPLPEMRHQITEALLWLFLWCHCLVNQYHLVVCAVYRCWSHESPILWLVQYNQQASFEVIPCVWCLEAKCRTLPWGCCVSLLSMLVYPDSAPMWNLRVYSIRPVSFSSCSSGLRVLFFSPVYSKVINTGTIQVWLRLSFFILPNFLFSELGSLVKHLGNR